MIEPHTAGIDRAVTQMDRLVRDLLDLARLEAGTFTLEKRRCLVSKLLREVTAMFRPLAKSRGVRIRVARVEPSLRVLADRERVLAVFSNLIGNAIKFTQPNGVIRLWARPEGSGVRLGVTDSGTGIAPEDLPRVFDLYWQGSRSEHGGRQGTGLGLGIVRGIVEAHGGTVAVESRLGQGSTFSVTLPAPAPRAVRGRPPAS